MPAPSVLRRQAAYGNTIIPSTGPTTHYPPLPGGYSPPGYATASGSLASNFGTVCVRGSNASTYPTVSATNTTSTNTNTTSLSCNLPASISSGDLLIGFVATDGTDSHTWPGGWTLLDDDVIGVSDRVSCYYRVADGSEGASISVTLGASQAGSSVFYKIRDYQGVPTVKKFVDSGTGTLMAFPSVKPAWVGNSLAIMFSGIDSTSTITWPSGPTSVSIAGAGTNSAGMYTAYETFQSLDTKNKLMVIAMSRGGTGTGISTGWPTGWQGLYFPYNTNSGGMDIWWKLGDGTETDFSITTQAETIPFVSYLIENHNKQLIACGAGLLTTYSVSTALVPAIHLDSADYLLIAIASMGGGSGATWSTTPTSPWTNVQQAIVPLTGTGRGMIASAELAGPSSRPVAAPAFAHTSGSNRPSGVMIAIPWGLFGNASEYTASGNITHSASPVEDAVVDIIGRTGFGDKGILLGSVESDASGDWEMANVPVGVEVVAVPHFVDTGDVFVALPHTNLT